MVVTAGAPAQVPSTAVRVLCAVAVPVTVAAVETSGAAPATTAVAAVYVPTALRSLVPVTFARR